MMPIATPPFYTGEMRPVVSNTQAAGAQSQAADHRRNDQPIQRLYAAGELAVRSATYSAGGNISKCSSPADCRARIAARRLIDRRHACPC
jgi:hypothetical protein